MPATTIVIFERHGRRASEITPQIAKLPARIRETRNLVDFNTALAASPFPVAIIDLAEQDDLLHELLTGSVAADAFIVTVGACDDWWKSCSIREQGALCILPKAFPPGKWGPLLERLVQQSQERQRTTG